MDESGLRTTKINASSDSAGGWRRPPIVNFEQVHAGLLEIGQVPIIQNDFSPV